MSRINFMFHCDQLLLHEMSNQECQILWVLDKCDRKPTYLINRGSFSKVPRPSGNRLKKALGLLWGSLWSKGKETLEVLLRDSQDLPVIAELTCHAREELVVPRVFDPAQAAVGD